MAVTDARRRAWIWLLCGALLAPPAVFAQEFDPQHSRISFELRTRWGQRLEGHFPDYHGDVRHLADGLQQVTVTLQAGSVEILGYPRYTEFSRGPHFFDVERFPEVNFQSDPYPSGLLHHGGTLTGVLRMHGVARRESFTVVPGRCAAPALDCDVIAVGSVRRENYGMDDWQIAVQKRVHFRLQLRLRREPG